jgi:hypothetical protein
MITEKDTIKCEAIFNEDRTHRLLWKRVWNKDKPLACVIMLNPCQADNIITDTSTSLVVNNIARLEEYGGVSIVNLFSFLTNKLVLRWAEDADINDYSNDNYIQKAAEEAGVVILAWGKSSESNARIFRRSEQVINVLEPYKEKLRVISDGIRMGLHPLTPTLRKQWFLEEIEPWLTQSRQAALERINKSKDMTIEELEEKESS